LGGKFLKLVVTYLLGEADITSGNNYETNVQNTFLNIISRFCGNEMKGLYRAKGISTV
jgi:hypothetical protein